MPLKKKSLCLETTQALKIPLMLPALKKKKKWGQQLESKKDVSYQTT